ncbi:MAG: serine hydrolase domain-containing protein [Alphaproteobacteria bacterium]
MSVQLPAASQLPRHRGALAFGARRGRQQWIETIGLESIEHGTPVSRRSRFMAGSVAKQFLGAAAVRVVKEGRASFDTPVANYVPSLRLPNVTLEQLLNHTSGLRETEALFALAGVRENDFVSAEDHLEAVTLQVNPIAPPGARFSYANINYIVLVELLKALTGERFADLVSRLVFEPAGLDATTFVDRPDAIIAHRCDSYRLTEGTLRRGQSTIPIAGPSGLWASPQDLLRWGSIRQQFIKDVPHMNLEDSECGGLCGWPWARSGQYVAGLVQADSKYGHVVGHPGDDQGYSAQLLRIGVVDLVALSSAADTRAADLITDLWVMEEFRQTISDDSTFMAARSISATLLAERLQMPARDDSKSRRVHRTEEPPAELEGVYECEEALAPLTVQIEGTSLIVLRGTHRDVLNPIGPGRWSGPGYVVAFNEGEAGAIDLALRRAGTLRFTRQRERRQLGP